MLEPNSGRLKEQNVLLMGEPPPSPINVFQNLFDYYKNLIKNIYQTEIQNLE